MEYTLEQVSARILGLLSSTSYSVQEYQQVPEYYSTINTVQMEGETGRTTSTRYWIAIRFNKSKRLDVFVL